jgi:hypothetical protein
MTRLRVGPAFEPREALRRQSLKRGIRQMIDPSWNALSERIAISSVEIDSSRSSEMAVDMTESRRANGTSPAKPSPPIESVQARVAMVKSGFEQTLMTCLDLLPLLLESTLRSKVLGQLSPVERSFIALVGSR